MHTKFKVLVRAWALTLSLAVVSVAGVSTSAMAQGVAPASAAAPAAVAADPAAAGAPAAKKAEGTTDNQYGIAERPAFYFGILSILVGTQLFLAGFLAELSNRNGSNRDNYLIEAEV